MFGDLHRYNIPVAICCFILGAALSLLDAVGGGVLIAAAAILHLSSSPAEDRLKVIISKFSIFAVWAASLTLLVLFYILKESFILRILVALIAASSIYTVFLFLEFTGGSK